MCVFFLCNITQVVQTVNSHEIEVIAMVNAAFASAAVKS